MAPPPSAGAELHDLLRALGHPTGFTDLHLYPGPHRQALFRWLLTGFVSAGRSPSGAQALAEDLLGVALADGQGPQQGGADGAAAATAGNSSFEAACSALLAAFGVDASPEDVAGTAQSKGDDAADAHNANANDDAETRRAAPLLAAARALQAGRAAVTAAGPAASSLACVLKSGPGAAQAEAAAALLDAVLVGGGGGGGGGGAATTATATAAPAPPPLLPSLLDTSRPLVPAFPPDMAAAARPYERAGAGDLLSRGGGRAAGARAALEASRGQLSLCRQQQQQQQQQRRQRPKDNVATSSASAATAKDDGANGDDPASAPWAAAAAAAADALRRLVVESAPAFAEAYERDLGAWIGGGGAGGARAGAGDDQEEEEQEKEEERRRAEAAGEAAEAAAMGYASLRAALAALGAVADAKEALGRVDAQGLARERRAWRGRARELRGLAAGLEAAAEGGSG